MGELIIYCAGTNLDVLPGRDLNALLINVPNNGGTFKAIHDTHRLINYASPQHVMLDSGGFQLVQAEKDSKKVTFDPNLPLKINKKVLNISPVHVVQAACSLRPHKMTALDFPINKSQQLSEFQRKMPYNVQWAKETFLLRSIMCPDVELFIPIQCYNLAQLDIFMYQIGDISYDGLSMPVRNLDPIKLVQFLIRFKDMGVHKVHLLGVSTFPVMAIAAYFARHHFDWVSMDATTWNKSAQHSQYMNPYILVNMPMKDNTKIDESMINTCLCPWCVGKSFTDIKNMPYKDKASFLRCHNFWVTESLAESLWAAASSISDLEGYINSMPSKHSKTSKLLAAIKAIEQWAQSPALV